MAVAVLLGTQVVVDSIVLRFLMVTARLSRPTPLHDLALALQVRIRPRGRGCARLSGFAGILRSCALGGRVLRRPGLVSDHAIAIPSATAIALGHQLVFAALFLSLVKWQFRSRW